jgi:hypothetical protein
MNWLMLFKEVIAVYIEIHRESMQKIQNTGLLVIKAGGTCAVVTIG